MVPVMAKLPGFAGSPLRMRNLAVTRIAHGRRLIRRASAANNCADYPGWNCDERITPLLADFVHADTAEKRKAIAERIQIRAYESTPAVMWGQFTVPAAYRTTLKDLIQSSFPMFWSVDMPDK